jgi:hypothetical protein
MTLWSYTASTEMRERAVVVYISGGKKPTSRVIALAEWDGPGSGVFIIGRGLGTQSETWRRLDEGALQAHAMADEFRMTKAGAPMITVAQLRKRAAA